jgi:hypothetical protein
MVEAEGAGEVFPAVHTYPDDDFGRVLEARFVYECESAPVAAKIAIHLLRGVRRLFGVRGGPLSVALVFRRLEWEGGWA